MSLRVSQGYPLFAANDAGVWAITGWEGVTPWGVNIHPGAWADQCPLRRDEVGRIKVFTSEPAALQFFESGGY